MTLSWLFFFDCSRSFTISLSKVIEDLVAGEMWMSMLFLSISSFFGRLVDILVTVPEASSVDIWKLLTVTVLLSQLLWDSIMGLLLLLSIWIFLGLSSFYVLLFVRSLGLMRSVSTLLMLILVLLISSNVGFHRLWEGELPSSLTLILSPRSMTMCLSGLLFGKLFGKLILQLIYY